MTEIGSGFEAGLDAISSRIEGVTSRLVPLMRELTESLSGVFSRLADNVNRFLDAITSDWDWLNDIDEPTTENADEVGAQIAEGAIDSYILNHPEGTEASTVYDTLFNNLQERFKIVEAGWDRQIYSIDCLSNSAGTTGGSDHEHSQERVMRNLALYSGELGVSDIIGLHNRSRLDDLVDQYNETAPAEEQIDYHPFTLHNFGVGADRSERDSTINGNIQLFATAHHLAHNAEGNVMTHCQQGHHRARTVWLVVRVLDNPPSFDFLQNYTGTPKYNELNETDRETVDTYIKAQMEAIGIPDDEFGYLTEAGDLLGQVGDISLDEDYRNRVLTHNLTS